MPEDRVTVRRSRRRPVTYTPSHPTGRDPVRGRGDVPAYGGAVAGGDGAQGQDPHPTREPSSGVAVRMAAPCPVAVAAVFGGVHRLPRSSSCDHATRTVELSRRSFSGKKATFSGRNAVPRGRPSRAAIHARLAEQVTELRVRLGGLPAPEEAEDIIRPFSGGMEPPPWTEVPARMTDWVADVAGLRSRYLSALDRDDRGDVGPLGELFARAILDNLNRFTLPAIAGQARLVPLEALATPELKVTALRKAVERGRLRATRAPNGTWRSSRQWVNEYRARRWSRGGQLQETPSQVTPQGASTPARRPPSRASG